MFNNLKNVSEYTFVEKLFFGFDIFFTMCLYIFGDFVVTAIFYIIGWVNLAVVPSGYTWSIVTKPCRYIMLLVLYVGTGAMIGSNLLLGYNSLQTVNKDLKDNSKANLKIMMHQNGEPFLITDLVAVLVLCLAVPQRDEDPDTKARHDPTIDLLKTLLAMMLAQVDRIFIEGWKIGH